MFRIINYNKLFSWSWDGFLWRVSFNALPSIRILLTVLKELSGSFSIRIASETLSSLTDVSHFPLTFKLKEKLPSLCRSSRLGFLECKQRKDFHCSRATGRNHTVTIPWDDPHIYSNSQSASLRFPPVSFAIMDKLNISPFYLIIPHADKRGAEYFISNRASSNETLMLSFFPFKLELQIMRLEITLQEMRIKFAQSLSLERSFCFSTRRIQVDYQENTPREALSSRTVVRRRRNHFCDVMEAHGASEKCLHES